MGLSVIPNHFVYMSRPLTNLVMIFYIQYFIKCESKLKNKVGNKIVKDFIPLLVVKTSNFYNTKYIQFILTKEDEM